VGGIADLFLYIFAVAFLFVGCRGDAIFIVVPPFSWHAPAQMLLFAELYRLIVFIFSIIVGDLPYFGLL
jgi:hypothetical protein